MHLDNYRIIFVSVGLIGVLLFASPTIGLLIKSPSDEKFSAIYLLGPEKKAENYPFNVAIGHENNIYVGVTNNVGSSIYYVLYVKLKNQTDLYPNSTTNEPSSVLPLYEYRFFAQNGENWECLLNFSVTTAEFSDNKSLIKVLTINNVTFNVNKPAVWETNSTTFHYQFLFELWIYNMETTSIDYDNRYASLQFNLI